MADQITTSLAQAKVLVMEGQKGADGKSPYIGANGNWFVWNGTAWVDTGIPASLDDAQIAAAVEEYLEEHPVSVTEQTVAEWGFTKNTGDYSKPSGGIPKADLASDVQTSLGKADTALQQHQSLSGYATESWVQQQGYLTQHQDISGKANTADLAAVATSGSYNDLSNKPTIPDISGKQNQAITDAGGYYTTDTVEGALQEIGAELAGINTLIGSGVIS